MRPLLLFLLLHSSLYPQGVKDRTAKCMGLEMALPESAIQKTEDNHCIIRSFPGDDFVIIVRKINSSWNRPVVSELKFYFLPESASTETTLSASGIPEIILWQGAHTVSQNELTTLVYLFPLQNSVYSVWVSWRKESLVNPDYFQTVFFKPDQS